MVIHVFGRFGDGPVLHRPVTLRGLVREWGPWARAVLSGREDRPYRNGPYAVWVKVA